MKKFITILLATVLLLGLFAGCNKEEKKEADNGEKKYRVAYVARTQSDSFAAWLANEMERAAEKYPDIELEIMDGQADDEKENAAIENAITNQFDAIIVQPNNGEAQRPYVEKIVQAGIIAITTNARIDGIDGASSVDADPYTQAKVNCEIALEQVPQNAKVVVLNGPSGNFHADERRRAWQIEFFDKRPDVEIVGEQIAHWNKDEAVSFMENWVQANPQIDAIISMNDNMAAGAIEVIKDNEAFNDILVYGVDGTPEACLLIAEGKMTSTCLQSAISLAQANIDTVHKLLTGEEEVINMDIDAILITKDTVDEYVEMYKDRNLIE